MNNYCIIRWKYNDYCIFYRLIVPYVSNFLTPILRRFEVLVYYKKGKLGLVNDHKGFDNFLS